MRLTADKIEENNAAKESPRDVFAKAFIKMLDVVNAPLKPTFDDVFGHQSFQPEGVWIEDENRCED